MNFLVLILIPILIPILILILILIPCSLFYIQHSA